MKTKLEKYKDQVQSLNFVESDWSEFGLNQIHATMTNLRKKDSNDQLNQLNEPLIENVDDIDEKLFLPFVGNGYIGLSTISKQGFFAYHQKTLSLPLRYSPLVQIYSETLKKKGNFLNFLK